MSGRRSPESAAKAARWAFRAGRVAQALLLLLAVVVLVVRLMQIEGGLTFRYGGF